MSLFRHLTEKKRQMVTAEEALPGRSQPIAITDMHYVLSTPLAAPFPDGVEQAVFGMGCFWGAEKIFWQLDGVYTTAVGYSAGFTENPSYEEVCTGKTGHNEVVLVAFNPNVISYNTLLKIFWEGHNPTQGMQQGNDIGTQYRSGIYTFGPKQKEQALTSLERYQGVMAQATGVSITTEVIEAGAFYYAEHYHQQYLAKNPSGYCGLVPIEQSDRPRFPL